MIALCVAAGLDYRQAAEALNIPVGTVRSRLSRARNRLARHLGRPGPARGVAQTEVRTVQGSGPTTRTGWMRETGKDAVMPGQRISIVTHTPVHAGLDHPTCTWPATLPTDPEALRTLLYAQTEPRGSLSQDETVLQERRRPAGVDDHAARHRLGSVQGPREDPRSHRDTRHRRRCRPSRHRHHP